MNRPKIEDFKPKYTKGAAEIVSVAKQYVKVQDEYIDYLEELVKNCSTPNVVKSTITCSTCGSTDLIMFNSDVDLCNSCGCIQDGV